MAYLHEPRLVFTGDFQADVSTVNNDVRHYDNATFEERFQQPGTGATNGWWNPAGGALFSLVNCAVRRGALPGGSEVSSPGDDAVIGKLVASAGDRSSGKMVDLDPQQQMTSELWGVTLRIYSEESGVLLEGDLGVTGFRDLQQRQVNANPNGQPLGAGWDAVLSNLNWGSGATDSPVLSALREATAGDRLAVHLNGFGYYYAHADGRFAMGRLLGSIGPYREGEPIRFAPCRRLFAPPNAPFFNYTNFSLAEDGSSVAIDLGASVPVEDSLGEQARDVGDLLIAAAKSAIAISDGGAPPSDQYEVLGEIDYRARNWLADTGGVVTVSVPAEVRPTLQSGQLLVLGRKGNTISLLAGEAPNGLSVRADQNVQRLDPGDSGEVNFFAFQWGQPLDQARINLFRVPPRPGSPPSNDPGDPKAPTPPTGSPSAALQLPSNFLTTDHNGKATLPITAGNPGNPRGYIDGQIYGLPYQLDGLDSQFHAQLDWVFVHIRDDYTVPENPTWADVGPTLTQFGNLYPIMSRHILDLGNRASVIKHREILLYAFTQPIENPIYMPVTRDLSANKLATLVKWLRTAPEDEADETPPPESLAATAEPAIEAASGECDLPELRPPIHRARLEALTSDQASGFDSMIGDTRDFEIVD